METTTTFEINESGDESGRLYSGQFKVKTILSRGDKFRADIRRRELLGPNSAEALPALQGDAFMLGQLYVRIVEAPEWWQTSGFGSELQDGNVIGRLFQLCMEKEEEFKKSLQAEAQKALEKMAAKK